MPDPTLVVTLMMLPPRRLAWLAGLAVVAGAWWWAWRTDRRRNPVQPDTAAAWWLWHWFTGGTLEVGRSFPPDHGWPRELARRAALAAVRLATVAAVVLVEYMRPAAQGRNVPTGVGDLAHVAVVGVAVAAGWLWLSAFVAAEGTHHLRWRRSLRIALEPKIRWGRPPSAAQPVAGKPDEAPVRWRRRLQLAQLTVPRGLANGRTRPRAVSTWVRARIGYDPPSGKHGEGVIVPLPAWFDITDKSVEKVIETTCKVLDLKDVHAQPVHRGRKNYVQFLPAAVMPPSARLDAPGVMPALEAASTTAPAMGLTYGRVPVAVDIDNDSPHVLMSVGTGGGKSSLIRTLVAQQMRAGAAVVVLDLKRMSQQWLNQLPNVAYCRDPEVMHDALLWLGDECYRRAAMHDGLSIDDRPPTPPRRLIVVCEEMNATLTELQAYWRHIRQPGEDIASPAVEALRKILFMGRQARMHVFAVAQMATARAIGGPEAREQFFSRVLARHTDRNWRMLVPEIPFKPASRHNGRVEVCIAGAATTTQAIYMTPHEARDWVREVTGFANAGRVIEATVADVTGVTQSVDLGERPVTVTATYDPPSQPAGLALPLRELAQKVGVEYDTLRQAIYRATTNQDPFAPPPQGKDGNAGLYLLADVVRFLNNRPRMVGRITADMNQGNEGDGVDRMELTNNGRY